MMIPSGISSEAIVKETRFCVQTEFAHRPKPRVTTTITLNGEVVEKVETNWEGTPLTEEDKRDIEQFLRKQHQKVIDKIRNKNEKQNPHSDKGEDGEPEGEDAVVKVDRELTRTEGVLGWAFMLKDGQVLSHRISDREDKERFLEIKELSSLLSSATHMGSFTEGTLESPSHLSVFVPVQDHFLGIKLSSRVDAQKVIGKIKSLT
jgi:hypothetical protein